MYFPYWIELFYVEWKFRAKQTLQFHRWGVYTLKRMSARDIFHKLLHGTMKTGLSIWWQMGLQLTYMQIHRLEVLVHPVTKAAFHACQKGLWTKKTATQRMGRKSAADKFFVLKLRREVVLSLEDYYFPLWRKPAANVERFRKQHTYFYLIVLSRHKENSNVHRDWMWEWPCRFVCIQN